MNLSIIVLIFWCTNISIIRANDETSDRLALLAIKSQIQDQPGVTTTSTWNSSGNFCNWKGVTCAERHRRRVTELNLSNQNIRGFLSPYIGNLSFLRFINLENNSFHGEIPQEIGRLFRLEALVLNYNLFSGTIPTNLSFCSDLVQFAVFRNNLGGEIPVEIGNLLKLEELVLGSNHLTGQLPASIGNLSALQFLQTMENNLSGWIPDTFGQLRSLTFLNVRQNQLSGMVPPPIYNISSLRTLAVAGNRLSGSLPPDVGHTLPNLYQFIISRNNFTGSLPSSLSNASNLGMIDASINDFTGKVLIDFSGMKSLYLMNLGDNNLGTGAANEVDFVNSLTNCSKLQLLGLYMNGFGGMLPHCLSNLSTTVTSIAMQMNELSGTIPPEINNLIKLTGISLQLNRLTGNIPHVLGELKSLQLLYLNGNNLQGSIPNSLGNLTLLSELKLGSNNLQGRIPASLGNCQNLRGLSVSKNKLTGTLPPQILGIRTLSLALDLSDNLFSGEFPSEVGSLQNLLQLGISRNQFSGEIPATLGACTSLEYLKMQGNLFSGGIPHALSSLRSIRELDLSHNNLSGQIPEYFENLSFLVNLNLSYNHFEGQVPTDGVFNNATGVSLAGNGKLCGGSEELHLPSCHSNGSKKLRIIILKAVIPVIVSFFIFLACFFVIYTRRRRLTPNSSSMLSLEQQFPMISYLELSKATNEFSLLNMIGQGSSGFVYKGILGENGKLVAVKVLNLQQKGASNSFVAECEALRNTRHRNLIKIITICSSIDSKGDEFKALVYEYMQNGSLEKWLHQSSDQLEPCNLSLIQRLNIAIDVASAIEYLHHLCKPPIVHGDLKPSNVLLDEDMVAHVGDFGLARILSDHPLSTALETHSSSIGIKGTVGYVAPEYGMGGELSMAGDVYSFGIMLLEMFSARRPTDSMFSDSQTLHELFKVSLPEKVLELVDPSLLLEDRAVNSEARGETRKKLEECLVSIVRTGVLCSMESPADRMRMTDVVAKLCVDRKTFLKNITHRG